MVLLFLEINKSVGHSVMSDSLPPMLGSLTIHGIFQARILEWLTIPFSRRSSQCRGGTQVSSIAADPLPSETPGKAIPLLVDKSLQSLSQASSNFWDLHLQISFFCVFTCPSHSVCQLPPTYQDTCDCVSDLLRYFRVMSPFQAPQVNHILQPLSTKGNIYGCQRLWPNICKVCYFADHKELGK